MRHFGQPHHIHIPEMLELAHGALILIFLGEGGANLKGRACLKGALILFINF